MMEHFIRLSLRDLSDSDDDGSFAPPGMAKFTATVLVLVVISTCCVGALIYFRRRRQSRKNALLPTHHKSSHHRSPSISTTPYASESIYMHDEKRSFLANSSGQSDGPIPEIRITFPDEEGTGGSEKGGRVVILRIADTGSVGMEPVQDILPPYQSSDQDRFHSLELDRIGGLKEKEQAPQRSS